MNISLFGGAFDPPHLGHQAVVANLLATELADEVWYLPVKNHHFAKQMESVEHRLAMLKLIVGDDSNVKIEEYELHQEGINYTYDTLVALSAQYPEHRFSFVIGSDNLLNFHRWLENRPLLLDFPFFVYPREGSLFAPLYRNMTPLTEMKTVEISSTQIREKIKAGQPITELVTKAVADYIVQHGLYV